ncbi:Fe2+-enterobactin ABC transporter substrate-binding protein [Pseudomonas sp. PS01297]|uniref:Fe2+-enterobactin ABC transporter substrate-binding protein n=1 Tax=Pseudomonas sp. PS01297 TaxID=2991433 RepID=UPI002499B0EE|nr:Fe2+-enterobactin ABC transporter substrate-binding protein [Pseudomonas sp. PS01297]
MIKLRALPLLSLAALLLASVAHAADTPRRIVSTTPSVTGILLAMNAPLIATAATTPSRLSDAKGFFTQWAEVADQRGVQVLYSNLLFDIEAVIGQDPDLLVLSATGADSVIQHQGELQAQGINTTVVNYSNQSWQQMAVELGKVTGLEQQAQDAIKRFDDYTTQVAATLTPPAEPVSVVGYNIAGSYSVGLPSSPQARLLSALGFKVASLPEALDAQVRRSSDVGFISRENLSRAIVGDSVFLLGGNDADVQAFLADPVLANLPAVINKRIYPLGVSSFRIDYYSGRQMIDTVARSFH